MDSPRWRVPLRHDPRLIISLSFVLLSLGSAIYVSAAALNYLLMYPALSEIGGEQSFQVDKLFLAQSPTSNQSSIQVQITVRNPSGYIGLRLDRAALTIYFYAQSNSSNTLFQSPSSSLSASNVIEGQLGPNSADTINIPIPLTPSQASQLVAFENQNSGQVIGTVILRIDIATFLLSVTGTYPYTRIQDIPLSVS